MSLPGAYYPLIGYRPPESDRWFLSPEHYLRVKASEAETPKPIDAPPILPDKVSNLLERVATDKEKRKKKKSFFRKCGKPKCITCNRSFNSELQKNQHLTSTKHKSRVANQNTKKYCEYCKVKFEDLKHFQEHVASKKHRKTKVFVQNNRVTN